MIKTVNHVLKQFIRKSYYEQYITGNMCILMENILSKQSHLLAECHIIKFNLVSMKSQLVVI